MTREKIRGILADCVANPSSGPVYDALDAMADAMWNALNPKQEAENSKGKGFDTAEIADAQ